MELYSQKQEITRFLDWLEPQKPSPKLGSALGNLSLFEMESCIGDLGKLCGKKTISVGKDTNRIAQALNLDRIVEVLFNVYKLK